MAEILYADEHIAVCVKPVGTDAEHGMPAKLAGRLSGSFWPVHRLDTAVGLSLIHI